MYTGFLSVNLRQNCTSEIKAWEKNIKMNVKYRGCEGVDWC